MADRHDWNRRYSKVTTELPSPCTALAENTDLLPSQGRALDIACGRGGNAFFLAGCGFDVTALDISDVAIDFVNAHALEQKLAVKGLVADILKYRLAAQHYHVIVISNFLERSICGSLIDALLPGGVLVYQTFVQEKVDSQSGPGNPAFLLAPNELLRLFAGLRVLTAFDAGHYGTRSKRYRNQAMLIAAKEQININAVAGGGKP